MRRLKNVTVSRENCIFKIQVQPQIPFLTLITGTVTGSSLSLNSKEGSGLLERIRWMIPIVLYLAWQLAGPGLLQ